MFPYGSGGPNASFAFLTAYYMRNFGATREDFGKLCVAQRDNALGYPYALFKKRLTIEEYLDARPIASPFDCSIASCPAQARGVSGHDSGARRSVGAGVRHVRSTCERHNAFPDDPIQIRGGWVLDRDRLYGAAGIEPVATSISFKPMTTIR